MTVYFEESPDFTCKCGWRGPATELDGAAENQCPKCGGKCRQKS